jgi:hypothetical protein
MAPLRLFCALCVAGACGGSGNTSADGRSADTSEDATTDVAPPACDVGKPFGAPVPVDGIDTTDNDKWGWQTSDGLTIYFARSLSGSVASDLYMATRDQVTGAFGDVVALDMVNTTYSEARPIVSGDGLTLYSEFVDSTNIDIHVSTRSSVMTAFSGQMALAVIDTAAAEFNPWISQDGLTMYFTSDRDGFNDIFTATRPDTTSDFNTPIAVPELNSSAGDYMGALSADGLEIFIGSSRDTNLANDDIFHATRSTPTEAFGAPVKLTELSDPSTNEYPTWLSADRCQLMFSSNRAGGSGGYDIWIASRPR